MMQNNIDKSSVEIVFERVKLDILILDELTRVSERPERVCQIFCVNSLKASPRGGNFIVNAVRCDPGKTRRAEEAFDPSFVRDQSIYGRHPSWPDRAS